MYYKISYSGSSVIFRQYNVVEHKSKISISSRNLLQFNLCCFLQYVEYKSHFQWRNIQKVKYFKFSEYSTSLFHTIY